MSERLFFVISLLFMLFTPENDKNGHEVSLDKGLNNPIDFEENFENNPVFNGLHTQFSEDHSFSIVDNPVYEGKFAGKFELRYGDRRATRTGRRVEVLFPALPNKERWYSFLVYFPASGYVDDKDSELISQWHNCCGTPTIGLRNRDGRLMMRIGHDRNLRGSAWSNFDLGPVPKDRWIEFVFHIIHSDGSDGIVNAWQNGRQVVRHRGPNMEKDSELPRWKIGIYKSTWDERPTLVQERIVYFDNIKLGNENATLEMMSSFSEIN